MPQILQDSATPDTHTHEYDPLQNAAHQVVAESHTHGFSPCSSLAGAGGWRYVPDMDHLQDIFALSDIPAEDRSACQVQRILAIATGIVDDEVNGPNSVKPKTHQAFRPCDTDHVSTMLHRQPWSLIKDAPVHLQVHECSSLSHALCTCVLRHVRFWCVLETRPFLCALCTSEAHARTFTHTQTHTHAHTNTLAQTRRRSFQDK